MAVSVLPSPVLISITAPRCRCHAPNSCTSCGCSPSTRMQASRTTLGMGWWMACSPCHAPLHSHAWHSAPGSGFSCFVVGAGTRGPLPRAARLTAYAGGSRSSRPHPACNLSRNSYVFKRSCSSVRRRRSPPSRWMASRCCRRWEAAPPWRSRDARPARAATKRGAALARQTHLLSKSTQCLVPGISNLARVTCVRELGRDTSGAGTGPTPPPRTAITPCAACAAAEHHGEKQSNSRSNDALAG